MSSAHPTRCPYCRSSYLCSDSDSEPTDPRSGVDSVDASVHAMRRRSASVAAVAVGVVVAAVVAFHRDIGSVVGAVSILVLATVPWWSTVRARTTRRRRPPDQR